GSYVGMDYHKKYSFLSVIDAQGRRIKEGRINGNLPVLFEKFLEDLPRPIHVVMEAGWTWIKPYRILEDLGCVEKIVLANPYKTRLIAEAQIKTDRIDARALAMLLKGSLIAEVHVPSAWSRGLQNKGQAISQ
ncbi:transposase, partial [Kamptonema cortianum]|nr:transposase [Kamptonema cortianum]